MEPRSSQRSYIQSHAELTWSPQQQRAKVAVALHARSPLGQRGQHKAEQQPMLRTERLQERLQIKAEISPIKPRFLLGRVYKNVYRSVFCSLFAFLFALGPKFTA